MRTPLNSQRRCAAPVVLFLACLSGCGHGGPITARLSAHVARPQPGVILFLADGLGADTLERGCAEGWLPNIRKRFVEGGLSVEHAMTAVPSITYPSIVTLLTGTTPAHHETVGNRWFDPRDYRFRNSLTINTYRAVNNDFEPATVYERIAPDASASIQCAIRRGVTRNFANWAASGVMWHFHNYTAVDKLTVDSLPRVIGWANRSGRWPSLLTLYFPGLDTVGHIHGPDSKEYRWAAWHVDHQIGRACDWLESQDLLKSIVIVLTSDHGHVQIRADGRLDLMAMLRAAGRNATDRRFQDGKREDRKRHFDAYDTVASWRDGRFATVHFKGAGGWEEPPDFEEVDAIVGRFCAANANLPPPTAGHDPGAADASRTAPPLIAPGGVELVAYLRSEREAALIGARGTARVLERRAPSGPEYAYVPDTADLFGYTHASPLAEFVAAGFHDSRSWLEATCTTNYPDAVPQIIPLLRCRRAGQMLVLCAEGYTFSHERGGHGGLLRREMRVPLLFAGPGILPGSTLRTSRAVDLTPTLLKLLGHDRAEPGEGRALPVVAKSAFETAGLREPSR